MSEPLLCVRGLSKAFALPPDRRGGPPRRLVALDDVSFDLERGESLGLVGESGSGKSTLARTVAGLEQASAGSIRYRGVELVGLSARGWRGVRRAVQMVFQDPWASLDPRQSVGAIVREPLAIHRLGRPRERRLRALALLEAVGLDARQAGRFPHELSGGQRQRVAIARALALEPELVLCDEPLSALDVSVQAQVTGLLRELAERFGLTYLFIAHDLAVVRRLCARVAVLYLGRLVEIAARDALVERARHPYTQALLAAVPRPEPGRARPAPLAGEPPSPLDPPPGCAFHPRCPRAAELGARCRLERPACAPRGAPGRARERLACHLEPESPTPRA